MIRPTASRILAACVATLVLGAAPASGGAAASAPPGGGVAGPGGLVLETRGDRVVVAQVPAGSAASRAGLLAGDVILTVDDQALVDLDRPSAASVFRLLDRSRGSSVRLIVGRGAQTLGVTLPAGFRDAAPAPAPPPGGIAVGSPAPDFQARDLAGETVSLDAQRGRPVLIDFWASWCPPCRDAALSLRRLADQYEDRLVVIGVSLDEDPHAFEAFVYNHHLPGRQVHDGGPFGPISTLYGASEAGIPYAVLVDARGQVAALGRSPADLEERVSELAGPPAPDRPTDAAPAPEPGSDRR